MAITILELRGSGDFGTGPNADQGQVKMIVLGADSQDEAKTAAEADPRAAPQIGEFLRGKSEVKELGPTTFSVDMEYSRGVPTATPDGAGNTPSDARTAPTGHDNGTPLGRDVSFSTGGATQKIFYSKQTRHQIAANNEVAPNFGKLIGVDLKTGEVHGCDVYAPTSDFTIAKRFKSLTIGWFRTMLDKVACVNKTAYLGCEAEEILFLGCDGNYKDGDEVPWSVTARYKYSRNRYHGVDVPADEADPLDLGHPVLGGVSIPSVMGHDYVWVIPKIVTETLTLGGVSQQVKISIPQFAYVERVYGLADLSTMGFD